jgi:hypothetical protein
MILLQIIGSNLARNFTSVLMWQLDHYDHGVKSESCG